MSFGRWVGALGCAVLASGCSAGLMLRDHPLAGRTWDARTGAFVSHEIVLEQAASARHVLLGEVHDNPEHHRLQRTVLQALAAGGAARFLVMEQFDHEHQDAIDAASAGNASVEEIADAGRFDRDGWNWPLYRPLVEFARARGWPLVAANLSRAAARAIVADPARSGLPVADAALREALERDLILAHCGKRPEARRLAGLVAAQRARDARMAEALRARPGLGSVLVAGNGHVRKDRGTPLYLAGADLLVIGFVEVEAERNGPEDYFVDGLATRASYDFVWFTPRAGRADPCPAERGAR